MYQFTMCFWGCFGGQKYTHQEHLVQASQSDRGTRRMISLWDNQHSLFWSPQELPVATIRTGALTPLKVNALTKMTWKLQICHVPHIWVDSRHWSSQRLRASELCWASRIWCSAALSCWGFPWEIAVVAVVLEIKITGGRQHKLSLKLTSTFFLTGQRTLKRVPMEENLDCLEVSSANGGKRFATNGHLESLSKAWCSATT